MTPDPCARPIFIVGTGRNGSTILYEALARHRQLGWISHYVEKWPRAGCLAILSRLYDLPRADRLPRGEKRQYRQGRHWLNKLLPKPVESYRAWARMVQRPDFAAHFMLEATATPHERTRVRRILARMLRWQDRPRFLGKFTGPSRIGYLASIFPDACFVHIVRDVHAVVRSGLEYYTRLAQAGRTPAHVRPDEPLWQGGFPSNWRDEWASYNHDPVAFSAMHVRTILDVIDRERAHVPAEQFTEIRYEAFVDGPLRTLRQVLTRCGLDDSPEVDRYVTAPDRYRSMNYKAAAGDIPPRYRELVNRVMAVTRPEGRWPGCPA